MKYMGKSKSLRTGIFIVFVVFIIVSCGKNKNEYSITGTIDGAEGSKIYISNIQDGKMHKIDSSIINGGRFNFKGRVDVPEMFYLSLDGQSDVFKFFSDNSEITITAYADSIPRSEVVGSEAENRYKAYQESMRIYDEEMNSLIDRYRDARKEGDEERIKSLEAELDDMEQKVKARQWQAFSENTSGFLGPYILYRELYYDMDVRSLDSAINLIDTTIQSGSNYVKMLREHADVIRKVSVGQPAPDFTMTDPEGEQVSLNGLKGKYKYLLVDFWASWCNPCRQENPNLVDVYSKYEDKGFEILGVSFDQKKDAWELAIKNDNLSWHQVSDLQGWDNAAGKIYGIRSIPSNILLNEDGIIIAKNLRGEELRKKMETLYN